MSPMRSRIALLLIFLASVALFVLLNFGSSGDQADSLVPDEATITRSEAEQTALAFAERQFGPGNWKAFAMFDADAAATGYLDKEEPEADPGDVWPFAPFEYYRVEVAKSDDSAHLVVHVAESEARVIGWEILDIDERPEAEWLFSAESAIRSLGYDPGDFADAKPDDETVVFTHRDQVGELLYRLEVDMPDGVVRSVVPAVEAPEAIVTLLEDYELTGALIALSSLLAMFLLGIAAIVLASVLRKEMSFGRGVLLTLACYIPFALYTAGIYPALRLDIPFEPGTAVFAVLFQQFVYLLSAASVWISLVAGEGLWRRMGFRLWPDMRDDAFAAGARRSVWIGYVYAGILLGVQAAVLYAGFQRFGVWATADPLNDVRNQLFPGLYPFLAWSAAISEEAVYRLFAIACFTMLFRPFWRLVHRLTGKPVFLNPLFAVAPAALIASILWGAAHVGYTVYPVYTRWIEVTILGLIFAWLLLRHGLMAAIFAHAAVDLLWFSVDLAANGIHGWLLGLLYLATPILAGYGVSLFSSLLRRRNGADVPLEP